MAKCLFLSPSGRFRGQSVRRGQRLIPSRLVWWSISNLRGLRWLVALFVTTALCVTFRFMVTIITNVMELRLRLWITYCLTPRSPFLSEHLHRVQKQRQMQTASAQRFWHLSSRYETLSKYSHFHVPLPFRLLPYVSSAHTAVIHYHLVPYCPILPRVFQIWVYSYVTNMKEIM